MRDTSQRLRIRGAAALAAVLALPIGAFAISATAAAPGSIRPSTLAPRIPARATRVGALDGRHPLSFAVVLAPSHPTELASLLHDLNDPASPRYGQWLETGEFQQRFGPSTDTVDSVVGWLHRAGFPQTRLVDGRIEVTTTAGRAADGLHVSFARFRMPDGDTQYSADQAPLVPRAVASDVSAVVGLSGVARPRPHNRVGATLGPASSASFAAPHAQTCAQSIERQANDLQGWSTRQTGARYQVPALYKVGLKGAGRTIALYELAPHTQSDVTTYLNCFGLHNTVSTVKVDGGSGPVSGGTLEANLDIESAAATAPGSKLISYEGPNSELGAVHTWAAIINDNVAPIVSTSWGLCEPLESASERNAMHALFVQAAAQGQTIFTASGDSGSEGCLFQTGNDQLAVDSPSNDPLVTAVGGTSLLYKSKPTAPWKEPVWNDCQTATTPSCSFSGAAGGGGKSKIYPRPSWQPSSQCPSCRGVPDLAANSGIGEAFASGGNWSLVGGTSIAAPHLAGIAADVVGGCTTRLGSFNPRVYALAKLGAYGSALRDVPAGQGDNDLTRTNGKKFKSANGYDLATGLGTPIAPGLACPEVARVRPSTAAAGARVTIDGLALTHATVLFGNQIATVVRRTAYSATVVVPAGSGTVTVRATGPIGSGTYHASFTYSG